MILIRIHSTQYISQYSQKLTTFVYLLVFSKLWIILAHYCA